MVTELDLSNNGIDDEGAKALASALHFAVLTELRLAINNIGDEGAKALASALSVNAMLNKINLRYNTMHEGKRLIQDAVRGREGFELNT